MRGIQIPNATDITVTWLNHTSGVMRYEFKNNLRTLPFSRISMGTRRFTPLYSDEKHLYGR
jgi:hypothetical protein